MTLLKVKHYVILVLDNCVIDHRPAKVGQYICLDTTSGGYFYESDQPEFFPESYRESHEQRLATYIEAGQVRLCPVMVEV